MKKRRSKAGETLVETLASVLIAALAFAFLSTAAVTAARINEIVREERGITADTALRLARYFGTSEDLWLNLQRRYDVERARDALGASLEAIVPMREAA